ncbi:YcaO-like family protein [Streptomyces erythrochromogenes]|uniref:YcaO-like family protein n=1 Tax=Streptomyces erythrochromogenes TaxID=285574 RepID=UPI00343A5B52
MFVANAYLSPHPEPMRFLDPDTLPAELLATLRAVEEQTGKDVVLIDMTADTGIPTTLAYAADPDGRYLRGCGTSLSRAHSIDRAVTELLQSLLADTGYRDERLQDISRLHSHPALHRCAALDLDQADAPRVLVAFQDTPAPGTPALHLAELHDRLASCGFTAYTSIRKALSNGVTTVHVQVPRLERFLLVTDGSLVLPGPRILDTLQREPHL